MRLVLPDRIELSTSPLPMECSTTELRQHATAARIGQKPRRARRSLPQGPLTRKRAAALRRPPSGGGTRRLLQPGKLRADPVPHFLAESGQRLDRADHDLEFEHFAG